jgi:hypothetical protein
MKLSARRGYKTAIVVLAHRLCRLLYALLRNGATRLGPFTETIEPISPYHSTMAFSLMIVAG